MCIKYVIRLMSGTTIYGDDVIVEPHLTNVIKFRKSKWYKFWKSSSNDISVIRNEHIDYYTMTDCNEEDLHNFSLICEESEESNDNETACNCKAADDCDDLDDGVDETPNSYFEFQPVDKVMYN